MSYRYRYPSKELAELLFDLGQGPQEITREEVFDVLGLEQEYMLTKLKDANEILRECGVSD